MINIEGVLLKARAYSLAEYEQVIQDIITHQRTEIYSVGVHPDIIENAEIEAQIQQHLKLNKKLFNQLLRLQPMQLGLIAEAWCLDACILLPILRAIAEINSQVEISIYLRDQNPELWKQFQTAGALSIPLVFAADFDGHVYFQWGPRTEKAEMIARSIHRDSTDDKEKSLSDFYLQDLTMDIQAEWVELFRDMLIFKGN
jgi:hypothetical protein